jgi:hypothetical protein
VVKVIAPLVLLGIAATSWALRPAARRLGAAPDQVLSPIADRREIVKAA